MRALSELIEEVKFNTNVPGTNRFDDARLIKFFNSAIREIQKIVFLANNDTNLLCKEAIIDLANGQEKYTLPTDMYADNAIVSVCYADTSSESLGSLTRISSKSRNGIDYGYFIIDKSIYISPIPSGSVSKILIVYYPQLANLTLVTDIPSLPDACEEFLMLFVERKIHYVDSSGDIMTSGVFAKEEKMEIKELFAENSKDAPDISITDYSFNCW